MAVIVEAARTQEIRQILRSLLYQRQQRLHWRHEEVSRRTKIADTTDELNLTATVVIGTPLAKSKQERARMRVNRSDDRESGQLVPLPDLWQGALRKSA